MVSFATKTRAFATATLLGTALVAAPIWTGGAFAQTTAPKPAVEQPAAKAPAKVAPGSGPQAARTYSTPERVEARINELHQTLGITAAQEPQWKQLAQTMRDNAMDVDQKAQAREKAMQTMGVMDDLKSYEALSKAHAASMTKLVAAFEPLYVSMSPDQKKKADAEFQGYRKRASNMPQQSQQTQ